MKTLIATIATILICSFAAATNANAVASSLDYQTIYTVDGDSSYTLKNEFAPGELPYSYIKFQSGYLSGPPANTKLQVDWTWALASNPSITKSTSTKYPIGDFSSDLEIWEPPVSGWWSAKGEPGLWNLDVAWDDDQGLTGFSGNDSTTLTVTPEPVSTILFLFGGAPLAAAIYRKRKKS